MGEFIRGLIAVMYLDDIKVYNQSFILLGADIRQETI